VTFREWRSLWRIDRDVKIPHLSVTVMTPWAFARALWYFNRREFQAWPSEYETSLVIGWRWPFAKKFREKKWGVKPKALPLAVYGAPMDEVYLARVCKDLHIETQGRLTDNPIVLHIGPTVKQMLQYAPDCAHDRISYWTADCPECARAALRLAIAFKAKYEPVRLIDPHEEPIIGFRRREAEAQARLKAAEKLALLAGETE
jgi:hypothetical protein